MQAKIRKWGHSLAVRIPRAFAAEARLTDGTTVDMSVRNRKLVIARAPTEYDFDDLLGKITPDNVHGEIDTGTPQGREVW